MNFLKNWIKIGLLLHAVRSILGTSGYIEVNNRKCRKNPRHPSIKALRVMLTNWRYNVGDSNFYFMDSMFDGVHYLDQHENSIMTNDKGLRQALSRDRKCPRTVQRWKKNNWAQRRQRGTCPWYYELNYDPLRFPRTLISARCKCPQCIGQNQTDTWCEQITIQEKVLRVHTDKTGKSACDENNTYIYKYSLQDVSIGCTCTYNPTSKNTPETGKT